MFLAVRLRVRRSCMGSFSCRKRCGILRLRGCGIGSEEHGREQIQVFIFIFIYRLVFKASLETYQMGQGVFFHTEAGRGDKTRIQIFLLWLHTFYPFVFLMSEMRTGQISKLIASLVYTSHAFYQSAIYIFRVTSQVTLLLRKKFMCTHVLQIRYTFYSVRVNCIQDGTASSIIVLARKSCRTKT